jgi:hypothetical protein
MSIFTLASAAVWLRREPVAPLRITAGVVVIVNLLCSLYASRNLRGLYADGVAYLLAIYSDGWFLAFDKRTVVQVLRQLPVVILSRYTSADLTQCGLVFGFTILLLPVLLCTVCWSLLPSDRKESILLPLLTLLIGVAATSMNAIGEATIATFCYWILFFLLIYRTRTPLSRIASGRPSEGVTPTSQPGSLNWASWEPF